MNSSHDTAAGVTRIETDAQALLAPRRHTWNLFVICLVLTTVGVLNASRDVTANLAPDSAQVLKADLIMIGMQWFWVYFIYRGMKEYGRSILDFFDRKSFTLGTFAGDCVFAVLAFGLIYACTTGVDRFSPFAEPQGNNPLLSSTPTGIIGVTVWLCLSMSAGICEEIVFRGYLQRQLSVLIGSPGLAILAQAIVFGIAHSYEGVNAVFGIVLHALVLGALAHYRKNIRAGVVEHAGWDILAGFGVV